MRSLRTRALLFLESGDNARAADDPLKICLDEDRPPLSVHHKGKPEAGFDVLLGRYPVWGYGNDSGTELTFEKAKASEVFQDLLADLDAFCAVAVRLECGLVVKPR